MNKHIDPHKNVKNTMENSQFSDGGIYVREDDQDWGSSGMSDIQEDSE